MSEQVDDHVIHIHPNLGDPKNEVSYWLVVDRPSKFNISSQIA